MSGFLVVVGLISLALFTQLINLKECFQSCLMLSLTTHLNSSKELLSGKFSGTAEHVHQLVGERRPKVVLFKNLTEKQPSRKNCHYSLTMILRIYNLFQLSILYSVNYCDATKAIQNTLEKTPFSKGHKFLATSTMNACAGPSNQGTRLLIRTEFFGRMGIPIREVQLS